MLIIIEEFVWNPSQRPKRNESRETKFRTAGTIPDDDELPPNFAHSDGRYSGRRERGECSESEAECRDNREPLDEVGAKHTSANSAPLLRLSCRYSRHKPDSNIVDL